MVPFHKPARLALLVLLPLVLALVLAPAAAATRHGLEACVNPPGRDGVCVLVVSDTGAGPSNLSDDRHEVVVSQRNASACQGSSCGSSRCDALLVGPVVAVGSGPAWCTPRRANATSSGSPWNGTAGVAFRGEDKTLCYQLHGKETCRSVLYPVSAAAEVCKGQDASGLAVCAGVVHDPGTTGAYVAAGRSAWDESRCGRSTYVQPLIVIGQADNAPCHRPDHTGLETSDGIRAEAVI